MQNSKLRSYFTLREMEQNSSLEYSLCIVTSFQRVQWRKKKVTGET